MTMTALEAAKLLHNNEYRHEGSEELFAQMKDAGLVAVFGASDDLMEFRGAENDEVDAYEGGVAMFATSGLLTTECEDEGCPYFERMCKNATPITAHWSDQGGFTFTADIPSEGFNIVEDGEDYCRGIVFSLSDCADI